jgi:uncharacterized protein YndB with AHSA1/START domain
MTNTVDIATASTDRASRKFTMSIDIAATPEDVWRALTDAGELVRWFPLQARVTPGVGGTIFWGWDQQFAWESQIATWEPNKKLTLVENRPAFDIHGNPLPEAPHGLAMEFTLESHAGRTRLRIVHSGFAQGASWDDELESVSSGWQFELRSLRHYLERHKGRDRHHASVHAVTSLDVDSTWQRLLSPSAFSVVDGRVGLNQRCTIASATGDVFAGTVAWYNPSHDLCLVVDDLDDGLFRMSTWSAGGKTGVQVWATTYDSRYADRVRALGERLNGVVERALA